MSNEKPNDDPRQADRLAEHQANRSALDGSSGKGAEEQGR